MGYPRHWLTQFGGTIGTSTEIWSCGIRMVEQNVPPGFGFEPQNGYLVNIAKPALEAWFLRGTSLISSTAKLAYVKCNEIDEDGNYADDDLTVSYYWPTPPSGGALLGNMPLQVAVCLSWETNSATRGLASKGRIYSPAPNVTVSTATGLFPQSQALGMAQSAATLLNSLDDSVGATGQVRPHIVSRGRKGIAGAYGPGEAHQIDRVRVDNRVDIQRRRANNLVATSSVVPFTY